MTKIPAGTWPSLRRALACALFALVALVAFAPDAGAASTAAKPRARAVRPEPRMTPAERAFVDTLEERTFRFYWDTAHPVTGLIPDRYPTKTFASVAAVGFGLAAYPVGIERGWITREQGLERVLKTLRFLHHAPQGPDTAGVIGYKGFYYHFLNEDDGTRFGKLELSFIDTGLLVAGALFCAEYFDRDDPREREVRALADSMYLAVDWRWMQPRAPLMALGWTPEHGHLPYDSGHYNETMLTMLLALGSPTHPADPATWTRYQQGYQWGTFHGQTYLGFAPLFGHQSSHVFVDFRGIRDAYMRGKGIDYFENSRRATLAQRQYAIDNPMGWDAYGPDEWGLSACDGPAWGEFVVDGRTRKFSEYWARGASHTEVLDDGTLTPNAPAGSIAFAPEVVLPTLMRMRERDGGRVWGTYGYFDAYNPTARIPGREASGIDPQRGWVDKDYLGLDQGLIVLMIENWRTGLIWDRMHHCRWIVRGLRKAGFRGGWLDRTGAVR